MIREFRPSDIDTVMSIWLKGNEQAHDFINPEFFRQNFDLVKLLMPSSTLFVQDINGVKGFIGLVDNYIAGLFVDESCRRQHIGQALIEKAKQLHSELSVHVYKKNTPAVSFYLSQGFNVESEAINEETNELELIMHCNVSRTIKIGKCAL